ncbi:pancreatic progenitor cell differentiation and proliferation factor isoform X2 [Mus pahari]|uniref:pancreatic progenitor cell differentiation and proliferation factor isoform X2 n=1 Tax=Mus pahari TaxID=10093 RepID=UPI001114B787|nr:pancreatic progenitor cell differentiation and proliferation factor isoform X2 [Mus pahari]
MAAIPSSGSLVATHDYYRRRLGSSSSNSSGGSAEYPGDAVPQSPGLPKADPGHWWASFFFGKSTLPFMATVLESPERLQVIGYFNHSPLGTRNHRAEIYLELSR